MEDISEGLERRPIPCEPSCRSSVASFPAKFRYVTRNVPGPGSDREMFEEQLHGCDCRQGCVQEACPCLKRFHPNYHPLTRQLTPDAVVSSSLKPVLECNGQCACDAACSNRLVQHGPRVRLKVAPAGGVRGFGLFALEDVQELRFVCEYAGEVVDVSEARRRLGRGEGGGMNYLIVVREHCATGVVHTCVDPRRMGNVGRFANHSCDPNLLMVPVRVDHGVPRLALFTRRDVTAGQELTFDYSGDTVLSSPASPGVSQSAAEVGFDEEHGETTVHDDSCQTIGIGLWGKDCRASVCCGDTILYHPASSGGVSQSAAEVGFDEEHGETVVRSDEDYKTTTLGSEGKNSQASVCAKDGIDPKNPDAVSGDGGSLGLRESAAEKVCVKNDVKRFLVDGGRCDESQRMDKNDQVYKDAFSHVVPNPSGVPAPSGNGQTSLQQVPDSSISETLEEKAKPSEKMQRNHNGDCVVQILKEDRGRSNTDGPSMPGSSNACAANARKRKVFHGVEGVGCAAGGQTSDGEPQAKLAVSTETGTVPAGRKACLCGSARCKGYLPFDSLIFSHA